MKYYFAPMEGITGYLYRSAHHKYFPGIDKYFTPFISPNKNRKLSPKDIREILPENNEGLYLVPQILTNQAQYFIDTALEIKQMGYEEVNLNLGCPSGTVVAKKKGSGFLDDPDDLDEFLDEIFSKLDMKISVKTRIGICDPDEFEDLLVVYNKYQMEELIVHPRLQKDYYKNTPHLAQYEQAVLESKNQLCYNGDIFTVRDFKNFAERFPQTEAVMLGRGLLTNPGLAGMIENPGTVMDKEHLVGFHEEIYKEYRGFLSGEKNVLFKMKEFWYYLGQMFTEPEKYMKKIKKAKNLAEYEMAVNALFREQDIAPDAGFRAPL